MTLEPESNSTSSEGEKIGRGAKVRDNIKRHLPGGYSIFLVVVMVAFLIAIYWQGFGLEFFVSRFVPLDGELPDDTITRLGLNIPEILLTVMLISGVIVMVISLGLLVVAYHIFNPKLITKKHSLGLPEGSVRSLLALMLILLFSILSVHIYWEMARAKTVSFVEVDYTGLPSAQMEDLRDTTLPQNWISSSCSYQMVAGEFHELCNVVLLDVREERNEESERFAQQVLTTISTLVIALAGFYFGSRAVNLAGDLSHQSAQRAEADRKRQQNTSS